MKPSQPEPAPLPDSEALGPQGEMARSSSDDWSEESSRQARALASDGPRVFYRDLDTANSTVTEATYASRTVGSGATQTTVTALVVGNRSASPFNVAWQGTISTLIWHNARLTQAELNVWAERPQPLAGTTRLFMELGWAGTGTQGDLSGNGNNGTVTGATAANHAPKVRWP